MLWKWGIWGVWVLLAAGHWQLVASDWFDKKPLEVILGFFGVGAVAFLVAKVTGGSEPALEVWEPTSGDKAARGKKDAAEPEKEASPVAREGGRGGTPRKNASGKGEALPALVKPEEGLVEKDEKTEEPQTTGIAPVAAPKSILKKTKAD